MLTIPDKTMTLPLAKSPELAVYEAVIKRVVDDPVLSKVIQSLHSTPFNFAPAPVQRLPALRIEAGAGSIMPAHMNADDNTLQIGFVFEVAQGYHGDLMNLWHALRKCIGVHKDDWLAQSLMVVPNVIYKSMSWTQAAITYNPIMETRTLVSTAILSVSLSIREC